MLLQLVCVVSNDDEMEGNFAQLIRVVVGRLVRLDGGFCTWRVGNGLLNVNSHGKVDILLSHVPKHTRPLNCSNGDLRRWRLGNFPLRLFLPLHSPNPLRDLAQHCHLFSFPSLASALPFYYCTKWRLFVFFVVFYYSLLLAF